MTDFYKILGVKKNASNSDLKKAFRKLAIENHPDKNRNPQAEEYFKEISKAYQILSDQKQRRIYDEYLKNGQKVDGDGEVFMNVYKFHFHSFNIPKSKSEPKKKQVIETNNIHEIFVTLNEVNKGCIRKIKISRTIALSKNDIINETKVFNVLIRPGVKAGTKIIFRQQGNREVGKKPNDVIFIIRDKPHELFKRYGSDIKYCTHVTLKQALCGAVVQVPTLQGENVLVTTQGEIIKPTTIKRIIGRGLPYYKEHRKRGDLLISFEIEFPDALAMENVDLLGKILTNSKTI